MFASGSILQRLRKLFERPAPAAAMAWLPDGFKFEPLSGLTPADKEFICRALGAYAAWANPLPRRREETYEQYAASIGGLIARAAMGEASAPLSDPPPAADRPAHTAPETTSPSSRSN